MKILVTGIAGFIGFHVAKQLLKEGFEVVGIDNLNDYYDVRLKKARLSKLLEISNQLNVGLHFHRHGIENFGKILNCFEIHEITHVIHLAAQAGVRYSIDNPQAYVSSNITGFTNILEACKTFKVAHLLYASTSSVYGESKIIPFNEMQRADHPIQFYAATKRANELMAHSYSHLFSLPTTGMRFFTVYGPWGRPDMALFKFTEGILHNTPIQLFNKGNHTRDFTYVADVADSIIKLLDLYPISSNSALENNTNAPYRILNIGSSNPVKLSRYLELIENFLEKKAIVEKLDLQPGDIPDTFADTSALKNLIGARPFTQVEVGVKKFVEWYLDFYGEQK